MGDDELRERGYGELAQASPTELLFASGTRDLQKTLGTVALTIGIGTLAFSYLDPGISPIDAFYYSIVTVSTVGYGDYSPESDGARTFVTSAFTFCVPLLLPLPVS